MAATKKSGSRSSGSRSKKSGASRSRSSNSANGSSQSTEKELGFKRSPTGGDHDDPEAGGMSKSEESQTGGKAMGRPPADEPDVYVYVPKVHVGELNIDVERLEAHLALRAEVAQTVVDPADVDDEMRRLLDTLRQ